MSTSFRTCVENLVPPWFLFRTLPMFADSAPHGAVGQPSLDFLLAAVEVGDLGTVDHSLCHAVAWQWAHVAASVAVVPSTELHMVSSAHLCVG